MPNLEISKRTAMVVILAFTLLVALGAGGWWVFGDHVSPMSKAEADALGRKQAEAIRQAYRANSPHRVNATSPDEVPK